MRAEDRLEGYAHHLTEFFFYTARGAHPFFSSLLEPKVAQVRLLGAGEAPEGHLNRLIIKKIGHLSSPHRRRVAGHFERFLFQVSPSAGTFYERLRYHRVKPHTDAPRRRRQDVYGHHEAISRRENPQ